MRKRGKKEAPAHTTPPCCNGFSQATLWRHCSNSCAAAEQQSSGPAPARLPGRFWPEPESLLLAWLVEHGPNMSPRLGQAQAASTEVKAKPTWHEG